MRKLAAILTALALAASMAPVAVQAEVLRTPATSIADLVAPANPESSAVGTSPHDGLTVSGHEVLFTRHGVTERLTVPLELPNGTCIQPDGRIISPGGDTLSLRPAQLLTFEGAVINMPIARSPSRRIKDSVASAVTSRTLAPASDDTGGN
jgi:hypothetical protein